jgi:DNA anti-recombination protein RmuC
MTHLESDGNLYQLLIFQVQERERAVDDISFVKYPERLDEDREKSFAGVNTKLARLFQ